MINVTSMISRESYPQSSPRPRFSMSLPKAPSCQLKELIITLMATTCDDILKDTALSSDKKAELLELFNRYLEEMKTAPDANLRLAKLVHYLSYEIFESLGSRLKHDWAKQWLLLDIQIESHLRLNGIDLAQNN